MTSSDHSRHLRHSLASVCRLLASLGFWLLGTRQLDAAPVTFRFEAVVGSAFPTNGGANLPFTISPGDSITATITFQPDAPGPVYPQVYNMQFDVAGTVLAVFEFQIRVANDQQLGIDLPGRIADPNNTRDVDINAIGDNIIASCLDGGSGFCGTFAASDNIEFRPTIVFTDLNPLLLTSDDLLGDSTVWNLFSRRELSLLFKNVDTGGTSYVGAYIAQVQQIPEPSTLSLAPGLVCALAVCIALGRAPNRRPDTNGV